MYNEDNLVYIFTILEAIEKIELYSKDFKDDESFYFANEQMNFNAVVGLLIAIGEENKKITEDIKNNHKFNWSDVSKMRDKISHNYRGINPFMVWDIIQNSLKSYKQLLIQILPKVKGFSSGLDEVLNSSFYNHIGYLKEIASSVN